MYRSRSRTKAGRVDASGARRTGRTPELTGNLLVDPEIHLPSPGMDVDIAYYYNAAATDLNGPFGYCRTISTNLRAWYRPGVVTLEKGNGGLATYAYNSGTGTYTPGTPGVLNTLTEDVPNGLWKETTPDGRVTAYPRDMGGMMTTVVYAQDAIGNRHTFTYQSGMLQTLQDAVGRKVSFSYDNNGLLTSIQDWGGRVTTFQYDTVSAYAKPLMTTVIGPSGCQTGYHYSLVGGNWMMDGITDPNGYATSYTYDSSRRVTSRNVIGAGVTTYTYNSGNVATTKADGSVTTQLVNATGVLTGLTDAGGMRVTYTRNANNQETNRQDALGSIWTTTYDSDGMPTGSIDPLGNTTTIQRDAYHNATTIVYADGAIVSMIYGYAGSPFDTTGEKRKMQVSVDPLGNRTSISYNAFGQPVAVTDPLGYVSTYTYDWSGGISSVQDPLGQVTSYVLDKTGELLSTTDPLGNITTVSRDLFTRWVTDPLGHVATTVFDSTKSHVVLTIDALGNRATYAYNMLDKLVWSRDMLGHTTTYVYDSSFKQVIAVVDPLGNRTSTVYDAVGRPLARQDALGYLTTTVYDAAGRPQASVDALGYRNTTVYDNASRRVASIDALGNRSTTVYDSRGRVQASVDALGYRSTQVYDLAGRGIASIDALGYRSTVVYDARGAAVARQDANGNLSTTVYDAAGRAIASVDALGYRTTQNYDAASRRISSQDANGVLTTSVYDNAGRAIASVDGLGNRVTFGFDNAGRQVTVQDARSYVYTTVYDVLGRTQATINPLGFIATQQYDAASRNTAAIDAKGQTKTLTYDACGANTGILYADAERVTYQYDALGRTMQMGDASGNTQYSYSARGELAQETLPGSLILTRTYDARGSRTVLVNPDSGRQTYTYDQLGRSRTITDTDGKVTTTSYDASGQRVGLQDASGATRSYAFDAAGRLTQQVEATAAGAAITTFTDAWDGVGNRLSRNHDGVVTTWTYDNAYRLTGQQAASANATFVYDAAGNILTKAQDGSSPMTMTYDAGNRLQTVTQGANLTTVTYDANGNLSTETLGAAVTTYQYDPDNRLTGIVNPDATRSIYTYSATGLRRTAQEPGAAQTLFVWDGDDYLQERAASTVLYVVQDAEILAEKRSGSRSWYVPDPLGSTSLLLDASLNVTDRFDYWPYGEERAQVGSSVTPFRYVGTLGYYRDAAGRLYVRARVLRPDYGRWLTEDLIGFRGGDWNTSAYVAGRAVFLTDPTGERPKVVCPSNPVRERELRDAMNKICDAVGRAGGAGLLGTGCLKQPDQHNCMVNWCKHSKAQVRCANIATCNEHSACAYSFGVGVGPGHAVYVCPACWDDPGCHTTKCGDSLTECILHEVAGLCGSPHEGGTPWSDPCDYRASCLCERLPGLPYRPGPILPS